MKESFQKKQNITISEEVTEAEFEKFILLIALSFGLILQLTASFLLILLGYCRIKIQQN